MQLAILLLLSITITSCQHHVTPTSVIVHFISWTKLLAEFTQYSLACTSQDYMAILTWYSAIN